MEVMAMVHSLNALAKVRIIEHINNNTVVAEYNGHKYTAVYNVFVGLYYVDDKYGLIE